jgi:hypothetical protein
MAYAATLTATVTTDKASYRQGQQVITTAEFRLNGTLYNTSNSARITIKNPSGSTLVNASSMSKVSTGIYRYTYTLSSSAPTGTWTDTCTLTSGSDSGTGTKTFTVDATAPVTTASPLGGSYTSAQTVTLTRNETGTTYYTVNGTTPTTSSAVYSAPLSIAATTTLKYFSRDTAGNSEAVKTQVYTITPPKTHDVNNTNLTWTGYSTCISCHNSQAAAMYQGVHYQWAGSAAEMTNGPAIQGKMDAVDGSSALNAYCINIQGSWGPCGSCHVGTGAKPVATATPDAAQLASIDCLMCHKNPAIATPYARVRNATTGLFEPSATVDMNNVVRTVIKPVRSACLGCHAKAGGGDAVKRGDLALASGNTTDANYDVHMATTRGNLACQRCHTYTNHRVAGRGTDLRPEDSTVEVTCSTSTCHPTKNSLTSGHSSSGVSHHIGRVACQTCHLPRYAKDATDVAPTPTNPTELTEMHRDWTLPEWSTVNNRYEPTQTKAGNLIPKYTFWDGTSWGNNAFNDAVIDPATGNYKVSRPNGGINTANTKLYPFKFKTAYQPFANGKLVTPKVATYFSTGNFDLAVQDGLTYMGMPGAAYTLVTTDEYQVLNHQIPPASGNVLACNSCHGSTTQINLPALGYALKAAQSVVCTQCHGSETNPGFTSVHSKHVDSEKIDCSMCHSFSRAAERGLTIGIRN